MACSTTCRSDDTDAPRGCKSACGSTRRRQMSLLEPDLAGYALMGAQLEMLAALGSKDAPRL
ncbi:MAG: hypothetical protein ACKO1J_07200 [Tagaea sp.]